MNCSVETSWPMTAIGKRGARSSGPIGWCVPGWRTGGGGIGRSAARLYQDAGMASSGKRKRVCSSIRALLHHENRLAPLPRSTPRDETAADENWFTTRTCAHGTGETRTRQQNTSLGTLRADEGEGRRCYTRVLGPPHGYINFAVPNRPTEAWRGPYRDDGYAFRSVQRDSRPIAWQQARSERRARFRRGAPGRAAAPHRGRGPL